jgi:hypothetical protein
MVLIPPCGVLDVVEGKELLANRQLQSRYLGAMMAKM